MTGKQYGSANRVVHVNLLDVRRLELVILARNDEFRLRQNPS
jgi:hypothetical protein